MSISTALGLTLLLSALQPEVPPSQAEIQNSPNTLRLAQGASGPEASIDDLAWLAGYWVGDGLGGTSEELWTPPGGDRMYGVYTLRKEERVVFSEAMMLVETDGSLALRVKHFTPEFVGWEEKDGFVSFPLVRLGDREAYFSGLTLRRSEGSLTIYLVLSQDGERTEHAFHLERTPLQ